MKYDVYLAAGYPIGSGVVEGACRHLVKDRMERTGMRWLPSGAQAMLDLRATYLNGEWDAFWNFHVKGETVEQIPTPLQRLTPRGKLQTGQIRDWAGGSVLARNPLRVVQRQGPGLSRNVHLGVDHFARSIRRIH